MPFSQGYYDPETLALMTDALDAACLEMKHATASEGLGYAAVRAVMAQRIVDAVESGERDPEELARLAMAAI